jgi:hypothetical protein
LAFSYWIDNLGFITEEKLAAIFIKPSLGVSNWPVIYYTFPHQLGNRSFLSPLLRFKKKFPHYHHHAIRDHQTELRADLYKGIVDSITVGETRASAIGMRTVLPLKFQGGFRDMKRRHMDAMALVQIYGKPDIVLTMTCNPNWQEI